MIRRFQIIILCFFAIIGNLFAQDIYVPIHKISDDLPQKIIIDQQKAIVDFKKYIAEIKQDPNSKNYIADLPEKNYLSIKYKKTALLVTFYSQEKNKKYQFIYRHKDVVLPMRSEDYDIVPNEDDFFISSLNFLNSYSFWTADQVNHSYDLLADYHRGVIKLFGYSLTNIAHKLCLAREPKATLFSILEENNVSCNQIKNYFKNRSPKEMNDFNQNISKEAKELQFIFECSQGLKISSQCSNIAQKIRDTTLNLMTIKEIID